MKTVDDIRREIERRLEQYKRIGGADGIKYIDTAISIVNDVCDPFCPAGDDGEEAAA